MRRALLALAALLVLAAATSADGRTGALALRTPPIASSVQADEQVAWSPDGKWIAFPNAYGTSRGLTLVRADGSGDWFVGPSLGAGLAAWSPDGRRIAWAGLGSGWELSVATPADRSVRRVEDDVGPDFAWSPDGRELAYQRRVSGDFPPRSAPFAAMVLDVRSRAGRQVASAPAGELRWSPDGTELVFTRHERPEYGCSSSLHAAPAAGGPERRVTGGAFDIRAPSWSPSADRLAYFVSCQRATGLEVVDRDGTDARRLAGGWWWQQAVWSPDGQWIAGEVAGIPHRLAVVEADGGRAYEFGRYPSTFSWSPDSRRLLVSTWGGPVSVAEIGGAERVLLNAYGGADWSPEGRKIAFIRQAFDPNKTTFGTCWLQLWVANADGTDPKPISRCRIKGTGLADRIWGTSGRDDINGFNGRDSIRAGRGADVVLARDGARDRIACGAGRDVAVVDLRDLVSRDCEVVRRR